MKRFFIVGKKLLLLKWNHCQLITFISKSTEKPILPKEIFSELLLKDHFFKSIYDVAVKTPLAGKGLRQAESKSIAA